MSNLDFLTAIPLAPKDAILGMTELFNTDSRSNKVNLGVGIYTDENGKVPVLKAVELAEAAIEKAHMPRSYLPIDGVLAFNQAAKKLLFGNDEALLQRIATMQTLAGTGALRMAADFLARFSSVKQVWLSDPTWDNHRSIFSAAGFSLHSYPYFDAAKNGLNFSAMLAALEQIPNGAVVVLQACCHNPTGADPTPSEWDEIIRVIKKRQLIPVLDIAYQGFDRGLEEDAWVIRRFAQSGMLSLVAHSFSKNFSIYSERIGALSVVTAHPHQAEIVLSQLKQVVRSTYSNPAFHGAQIVLHILRDKSLYDMWHAELTSMRKRIHAMRLALSQSLGDSFAFINAQHGMFSYSGLSAPQMQRLRKDFAVYGLDSGRICVAALNQNNLAQVSAAIHAIL